MHRRSSPLSVALAAAAFVAFALSPAQAQDRVALVIGNGKYVHAQALPNPANDARAIAGALREIGFAVVQGADLDRSGMERALFDFLDKARTARVALIFYAGHGLQVDGRNYLVPVDAKLESARDLNFGMVELDKVLASLDDPNRANIVILDACRDNPLTRSFAAKTRSGTMAAGLAALTSVGTGTLLAFATAPDKVALNGRGANSPFTEGLLKHLRTPGLEVRQMLTRVRADVARATSEQQVPWDNSSLRGDIYLAGLPTAPDAPRVAPPAQPQPPSEAAQAWAATKDTSSQAVLEAFIRRFGDTIYGDLARARLDELKRAAVPAPQVIPPPPPPPVAALPPREPPVATPSRPVDSSYPQRPITLIVPFPPGGSSDIIARLVGQKISQSSGQQVVIENRPGGGGTIGASAAAKASPDGYTLFLGDTGTHGINPSLFSSAGFDARRDFVAGGLIGTAPYVLVAHSSLPARTVAELITYARANPGKLTYGSAGNGTFSHLAAELFKSMAKINYTHVPYRGAAPALTDLLAGQIQLGFFPAVSVANQIKSGQLRALAVTAATRISSLPNVPTISESGLPGYAAAHSYGLAAPRRTPSPIVEKLNSLLRSALAANDLRERLVQAGIEPMPGTTDAHAAMITQDQATWSKVIREAGISLN